MKGYGKKGLSLLLTLVLLLSLLSGLGMQAAAAQLPEYVPDGTMTELAGGAKTAAGTYSIADAGELRALSTWINAGNTGEGFVFCLTADVDLGGWSSPWVPIGQIDGLLGDLDVKAAFFGTFDGLGHRITGLRIGGDDYTTGSGRYNAGNGLFGQNFGLIRNVFVEAEIHTYRQGGAVAGLNFGTVQYCATAGSISANGGGGTRGTGGVVGSNYGVVEACCSSATVYNDYRRAGGIVGYNAEEVADMAAHGTWNVRGDQHLSQESTAFAGRISDCFFTGYASSRSQGYSGGVAASNDGGCTIANCFWLEGSSADNVGWYQEPAGATGTFDADGLLSGGTGTLLEALNNEAFVSGGRFPVLWWAAEESGETCTVTLQQPAAGGSLTAVWGAASTAVSGSAAIPVGETVTLTASAPESGYFFDGFSLAGSAAGGTRLSDGSFSVTWTVSGDALLTASYVSCDASALTLATQAGENGELVTVKTYSWNDLFSMAEEGTSGYMYTHGTDGWNVVGATRWVTVSALLADAGISPAAEDQLVAMAADGSPRVIPTWSQLQETLSFYPQAADLNSFPTQDAQAVPTALALNWSTVKEGATTGDMLAQAAEKAVFSGSLRFVYGSAEADYLNAANEGGTLTGNRLWSGVVTLAVRSQGEPAVSAFGGSVALSTLKQYETARTLTKAGKNGSTSVDAKGITALDLIEKIAGKTAEECLSLTFTASDGFSATVNAGDAAWADVMLLWEGNGADDGHLSSAVENGGGKLWVSGVVTVTGEFSQPEPTVSAFGGSVALSTLKQYETARTLTKAGKNGSTSVDAKGITALDLIEKIAGKTAEECLSLTFTASDGFSATVNAGDAAWADVMLLWEGSGADDGHLSSAVENGAGKLWVSGVVTVTGEFAEAAGGGDVPGGDSGSGSQTGDREIVLTVGRKLGKNGSFELLKEYTLEELNALAGKNPSGWAYLYYKGSAWEAIVATELVELDALLADSGASENWTGGSYLEFTCSDGVYIKSYPSYDDIREKNLFVSEEGSSLVPAGLATVWQSGTLDPVTADSVALLASKATIGSLRFVYGMSENQFTDLTNAPAGARSPFGVLGLTVVYDETEMPEGSVGTAKDVTEEEKKTDSAESSAPGSVTARTADGVAAADLDADTLTKAAEAAKEADAVTITVESEQADAVELTLDAAVLKAAAGTEKSLAVETKNGAVTLSAEALGALAEAGSGAALRIENGPDGTVTVDFTLDGKTADVELKAALPAAAGQVLAIVRPDGSEEIVKKSLVEDGTAYALLPAGSTVKTAENRKEFSDVAKGAWYASAVDFAAGHELFRGVSESEFAPGAPMTRAMLVTVLFRLENEPETAGGAAFGDVAPDRWYSDAVAWAAQEEIVLGKGDGFAPSESVTREQIAAILYRYAGYLGLDTGARGDLSSFGDGDKVSSWASDAMAWAVETGLFQGDGTGNLDPGADASRAEVAALLQRLVRLIVK